MSNFIKKFFFTFRATSNIMKENNVYWQNYSVLTVDFLKHPLKSFSFTCLNHHHVVPLPQISLILSRHFSLSFIASGRSSGLHPVSSHNCCMYVCMFELVVLLLLGHMRGSIGVHRGVKSLDKYV